MKLIILVVLFMCASLHRVSSVEDDSIDGEENPFSDSPAESSIDDLSDSQLETLQISVFDTEKYEEVQAEPTEEEKRAIELFELGMKYLNSSHSQRKKAHEYFLEAASYNHSESMELVAKAYLFGSPWPINLKKAAYYFKRAAMAGNANAQMYLGFLYSSGLGVEPDQGKALVYYTVAASSGNTWAQMAMAYRHWSGISVLSSCESALAYYRRVAKKVEGDVSFSGGAVVQRIRLIDEVENPGSFTGVLDDDLIQYYQFLADKGDVQAQVGLGQLHYQGGRGVEQNHERALNYFLQAADAGNANAMAFLGKMYLEGSKVVKQSNETAKKYFESATEKGNPVGQSGLGLMYLYGKGVTRDYAKAFKYFTQAANQGWVDGQLQLGIMYFNGLGVPKDYRTAIKYFTMASQSGHVLGYYNLAQMHASGTGTTRSCNTAVELFKNVAERGRWGSLLMQAHTDYKEGRTSEAFVKYALMAELGYEVSQSNSAFLLDRQEVDILSRNETLKRALMYWSRSAAQGYSVSRVKLGDYHYYGLGTRVDFDMAAAHYRIASEQQHNAQALFNLGYMHEQGFGLHKDYHLAKRYYDLAAETSNEAQVPVALARLKLGLVSGWHSLHHTSLDSLLVNTKLYKTLGPDWDLYLMTGLAAILGIVVYIRRMNPA
ncbi:Protein sel-1 -like protein 1 [Halotydeus destructor]|nr:Protein sel-1 -like protein 1 [Halotydeus destructor]